MGRVSSLRKACRFLTECVGAECRWDSCLLEPTLDILHPFPSNHSFHLGDFSFAHLTDPLPESTECAV